MSNPAKSARHGFGKFYLPAGISAFASDHFLRRKKWDCSRGRRRGTNSRPGISDGWQKRRERHFRGGYPNGDNRRGNAAPSLSSDAESRDGSAFRGGEKVAFASLRHFVASLLVDSRWAATPRYRRSGRHGRTRRTGRKPPRLPPSPSHRGMRFVPDGICAEMQTGFQRRSRLSRFPCPPADFNFS